jgi:hypothetical protein
MKNQLLILAACASLAITACKKESNLDLTANKNTAAADISITGKTLVSITENITENTTWTAGNVYRLDGQIGVRNNATLTIEAGTVIYGKAAVAPAVPGALIVEQGSKLIAIGTETNPIVFTSYRKVDNDATTAPLAGDFGGIVLLGKARTNLTSATTIEGVSADLASWATYGLGTDDSDNSGTLQYVRIEYAGYSIEANKEINGLTCAGVGSGTTLDHIEVYYGKDDAFEFFGGTVNASYLLAYAQEDDGLDFDNGYTGTINYAVVISDLAGSHTAASSGTAGDSNAIECDNNSGGTLTSLTTKPVLKNITIVGAKVPTSWNTTTVSNGALLYGARFRRATNFDMQNSVIIGYPIALRVEGLTGRYLVGVDSTRTRNGVTTVIGSKTGTKKSTFQNNYVQSFSSALSYATSTNDVVGNTPLAANVNGTYLATKFKCIVDESNTSNSNYNSSLSKSVFIQPFVNATGAVNLGNSTSGSAKSAAQGHLAPTMIAGVNTRPTWGKNWTAGVYGF